MTMPYTQIQKRQHVRELQTCLHALSYQNSIIPRIVPDGYFGRETALAVRAFQREYGLPETGSADYATWNRIVQAYRDMLHAEPLPYNAFPSAEHTVRTGDTGCLVCIIEYMLCEAGKRYDNVPRAEICGIYTEKTADAVRAFQRRTGLPQSGTVDSGTWNMLVRMLP